MFIAKQEVRPCIVKGKKAIFHGFTQIQEVIAPGLMKGSHPGGTISNPAAIIELENGLVTLINPSELRFCDSKGLFAKYAFDESEEE